MLLVIDIEVALIDDVAQQLLTQYKRRVVEDAER